MAIVMATEEEYSLKWSGDAGLVASLNDMIAYEKYLDQLPLHISTSSNGNLAVSHVIPGIYWPIRGLESECGKMR